MKKTRLITAAIGLCMAAALLAGCSSQGGGSTGETVAAQRLEGGQTQIAVEPLTALDSLEGEYGFIHNGYKIAPGMLWNDAKAILGDDYDEKVRADCGSDAIGNIYWYDGFNYTINSKQKIGTDVEVIDFIEMGDPLIDCGGFHVGDNVEDVKAVLGTPDVDLGLAGVEYWGNNTKLVISVDATGKIFSVQYGMIKSE